MNFFDSPDFATASANAIAERRKKNLGDSVGMTDAMAKEAEKSDVADSLGGKGMSAANKAAISLAVFQALMGANKSYMDGYANTKANQEKKLGILQQSAPLFG